MSEISAWEAFSRLHKLETDSRVLLKENVDSFKNIEGVLGRAGYDVFSGVFSGNDLASVKRAQARDKLIDEYNQKFNGRRSKLPTSSAQLNRTLQRLQNELGRDFDFNNRTLRQKVTDFGVNFLTSLWYDFADHPILFAGVALGAPVVAASAPVAALGWVGGLSVDAMTLALFKTGEIKDIQERNALLNKEIPSQLEALPGNIVEGFAAAAGFKVLGKVAGLASRGLLQGTRGVLDKRKMTKGVTALQGQLSRTMADATAEERAQVIAGLKRYSPSGVMTYADKMLSDESLKKYFNAVVSGDDRAARDILSDLGAIVSPENRISLDLLEKNNATSLNNYLEAETAVQTERSFDLTNLDKELRYGTFDIAGGTELSDQRRAVGSIVTELKAANESGAITDAQFSDAVGRVGTTNSLAGGRIRRNFTELMEQRKSSFSGLLKEGALNEENFAESLAENFSFERLRGMKNRDLAVKINKTNNQIAVADRVLTAALGSESTRTGFFSGNSLAVNVKNSFNAVLENIDSSVTREINETINGLMQSVATSMKSNNARLSQLDLASFIDSIMSSTSSRGVQDTAASAFKRKMIDWEKRLIANGLEVSAFDGIGLGQYFPNNWSSEKIFGVSKEFFVNNMVSLVDEEAMKKLARARGKPINDIRVFLGERYEAIRVGKGARNVATTTGDMLFSGDRVITMKDGASWVRAHELFGKSTDASEVIPEILKKYHKLLVNSELGVGNTRDIDVFNRGLFNSLKEIAVEKGATKASNEIAQTEKVFNQMMYDQMQGHTGNLSALPKYLGYFLKLKKKAMLSTASVTAFFTDFFGSMPLMKSTLGIRNQNFVKFLSSIPVGSQKEINKILAINHHLNTDLVSRMEYGFVKRTWKDFWGIPDLALQKVSDFSTFRANTVYATFLEDHSKKPFMMLPKQLRGFLSNAGVSPSEWEIYRKLPAYELAYGVKARFAGHIQNTTNANSAVVQKFAVAEKIATLIGAPENTKIGAVQGRLRGNTAYTQFLSFLVDPFANISYSLFLTQWNSLIQLGMDKGANAITLAATQLLMGGYLTYGAKAALRGKKVDFNSPNALVQSLMYSNIAGNFSDIIIDSWLGFNSGVEVPGLGLLNSALKGQKGLFSKLRNEALGLNPYKNVGLAGQVIQRWTVDQIFQLLDPEGYDAYIKNMTKKNENGELRDWAFRALVPSNLPQ